MLSTMPIPIEGSPEAFSWTDKDSVVVEAVEAIAVYRNGDGNVVIRQQDTLNHEDSFVVIPIDRVKTVIAALQRELES